MIILAALLAAQITAAAATRDRAELTVQVLADGPIDAAKVTSRLESRRLVLQVPATLEGQARVFHADHRYIQARRAGDGVELEVPIGSQVSCAGPVSVVAISDGLEARVTCAGEPAEATVNAAPPVVAEAAKPAAAQPAAKTVESKPIEAAKVVEVKAVEPKLAEALKAKAAEPAATFETASPPADLLADSKKSSPIGAAAAAAVVVVLGAAAYALRNRKKSNSSRIEVLETAALGPKRSLILARVGGKTLLLASSESGISLLENVVDDLTGPDPLPAAAPALLSKLRKLAQPRLASSHPDPFFKLSKYLKPVAPQFDALFAEEQEDQELRQKLLAGQSVRAR